MLRHDRTQTPVCTAGRVSSLRERRSIRCASESSTNESPPMLWRVDDRLTTRGVTGPFAEALGADPLDLIGQPWFGLMTADDRESLHQLMRVAERRPTAGLQ